ncbi:IS66 family insertion sequence element accessory protein TnpA [Gaoshiqia sediminis]|uniref:Transposase n=1 Tax=Gaoshiqia sediminis TaxID=2986998 RepID=A0AA41YC72_9BACT|nr:transposase [Gaoshiqia sediminis]MCW0483713.1 transposase [Gaoshiqia sediminis]
MRMTLSTFKKLYQEYLESGLNVKDFCANQGFVPSTFYYWKKQLGETIQPQPERFVPLVFDSNQPTTEKRTVQALETRSGVSGNNAPIEFVFPNGTKMVIRDNVDMSLLKAIVHLFD